MKCRLSNLLLFCFCVKVSLAQKTSVYYNEKWEACTQAKAVYFCELEKTEKGWYRVDYSIASEKLLKHGFYKDSLCTIRNGVFESFFGNGSVSGIKHYENNEKTGLDFIVYPNGFLSDSFRFKKDIPYGVCVSWYPDGSPRTEMQLDTMGNGSGLVIGFFPDGTVSFKGKLAPGLRRTGNWFYYHTNGQRAAVLQYPPLDDAWNGVTKNIMPDHFEFAYYDTTIKYTSSICYDTSGIQQAGCKIENKIPEYPKGVSAWTNYLTNIMSGIMQKHGNLEKPASYIAQFTVTITGEPIDIMLDNTYNQSLDTDVLSIFRKSRKWIPARHNNRVIPFTHRQSLTLGVRY